MQYWVKNKKKDVYYLSQPGEMSHLKLWWPDPRSSEVSGSHFGCLWYAGMEAPCHSWAKSFETSQQLWLSRP